MNSWKSIGASECAPPLMMFIIGTGSTLAFGPPRYLKSGRPDLHRGRPCSRKRDREDRIRTELALVRRAVERHHRPVYVDLIESVHVRHFFSDGFVHIRHSFRHAAAKEAFFHVIAQLPRLMFPCASAARDNGIAGCAAGDSDDSFNSWITARIDDLPGVDSNDFRHGHNRCSSF